MDARHMLEVLMRATRMDDGHIQSELESFDEDGPEATLAVVRHLILINSLRDELQKLVDEYAGDSTDTWHECWSIESGHDRPDSVLVDFWFYLTEALKERGYQLSTD